MERQATDLEKMYLSRKLYSEYIRNLHKSVRIIEKWAKYLKGPFAKEDIQIVVKHMKNGSASLFIREIQIQTTIKYTPHLP